MKCFGGPGEIRTHDLFHAMEARSQLRHRPTIEDAHSIAQLWPILQTYRVENWDADSYRLGSPAGRVFQRRCIQSHWSGYWRMTLSSTA